MPTVQLNARDLVFEVSDMALVPVWTEVGGINDAKVDYSANEQNEDTTTYDDDGNYRQEIMQRGGKLDLAGRALVDSVTGVREPGQLQLNTHALAMGSASVVDVRMRYPGWDEWIVWAATVSRKEEGGGNNAKVPFAYEIVRCGAATTAEVV